MRHGIAIAVLLLLSGCNQPQPQLQAAIERPEQQKADRPTNCVIQNMGLQAFTTCY